MLVHISVTVSDDEIIVTKEKPHITVSARGVSAAESNSFVFSNDEQCYTN